jgi:hypothetical protein
LVNLSRKLLMSALAWLCLKVGKLYDSALQRNQAKFVSATFN